MPISQNVTKGAVRYGTPVWIGNIIRTQDAAVAQPLQLGSCPAASTLLAGKAITHSARNS